MSARELLADEAKARTTKAIQEIERRTAAEIVVAVRPASAGYHHAELLAGAIAGMATLLVLLFMDREVPIPVIPYLVLVGFLVGAAVGALVPPLRRLLTRSRSRRAACRVAAKAAFFDLGVSRTHERTGVLVYVSLLERCVELLADVGIGDELAPAAGPIEAAVRAGDVDAFIAALGALAAPLEARHPRRADDVNELPDEVNVA
jgi:putative membrane protein